MSGFETTDLMGRRVRIPQSAGGACEGRIHAIVANSGVSITSLGLRAYVVLREGTITVRDLEACVLLPEEEVTGDVVQFLDIPPGRTFGRGDSKYIKVARPCMLDLGVSNPRVNKVNAVNLGDGELMCFGSAESFILE